MLTTSPIMQIEPDTPSAGALLYKSPNMTVCASMMNRVTSLYDLSRSLGKMIS
jgi:hypothetical protein